MKWWLIICRLIDCTVGASYCVRVEIVSDQMCIRFVLAKLKQKMVANLDFWDCVNLDPVKGRGKKIDGKTSVISLWLFTVKFRFIAARLNGERGKDNVNFVTG